MSLRDRLWLSLALFTMGAGALPAASPVVRVATEPAGAEVWIGARRIGLTTPEGLVIAGLAPGRTTLTLKRDGYADAERTLEIGRSSAPVALVVRLLRPGEQEEQPARLVDDLTGVVTPQKHRAALTVAVLAGALGVGVGAAKLPSALEPDPTTVDDDGDGFSEVDGDCDDRQQMVKPDGRVQVSFDSTPGWGASCGGQQSGNAIRVSNRSCRTITLQSASRSTWTLDGMCSWGGHTSDVVEIPLTVQSLRPGALGNEVARRGGGETQGCCDSASCCLQDRSCRFRERITLDTSEGPFSEEFTFQVYFGYGDSCPPCTPGVPSPVCAP